MGSLDFLLHPGRRLAFHDLHDIRNRVSGRREQTHVYVVFLDAEFNDFPMFPLGYSFEDSSQLRLDLLVTQYFAPVFRSPHQVVFHIVETV